MRFFLDSLFTDLVVHGSCCICVETQENEVHNHMLRCWSKSRLAEIPLPLGSPPFHHSGSEHWIPHGGRWRHCPVAFQRLRTWLSENSSLCCRWSSNCRTSDDGLVPSSRSDDCRDEGINGREKDAPRSGLLPARLPCRVRLDYGSAQAGPDKRHSGKTEEGLMVNVGGQLQRLAGSPAGQLLCTSTEA